MQVDRTWETAETTTHQDHVIAHVIGATILGYLVWDEVLYILLDIGFIWAIFLDGQMTLLPHPVAVSDLEIEEHRKEAIKSDIGILLGGNPESESLSELKLLSVSCQLKDVSFAKSGDRRSLTLRGEESDLAVVMSLATAEIRISECRSRL